jgi:hypothetical protein
MNVRPKCRKNARLICDKSYGMILEVRYERSFFDKVETQNDYDSVRN